MRDHKRIDNGFPSVIGAIFARLHYILAVTMVAGLLVFGAVNVQAPKYTSEAQILVENQDNTFTRPVEGSNLTSIRDVVDEASIRSQVQLLQSYDLSASVATRLGLESLPEFDPLLGGMGLIPRAMVALGFKRDPSRMTGMERVNESFSRKLKVFKVDESRVITVRFSSSDPQLPARVVNALIDEYILLQREAKQVTTRDASTWLSSQIDILRERVSEAEQKVADFRSKSGLLIGVNNTTLNAQQLSELNSQLILSQTQRSEAQARAQSIRSTLASGRDIDSSSDVLQSQLLSRLQERLISLRSERAELLATLLPGHPRVTRLDAEIEGLRQQTRSEMGKIAESLETDAEVAGAREASIRANLEALKTQVSGTTEEEVQLRAFEREAKAQRDLLESLLARFREASARQDPNAVSADARIISRPVSSNSPSEPSTGILVLAAMIMTGLISMGLVVSRHLMLFAAFDHREEYAETRTAPTPVAPSLSDPASATPAAQNPEMSAKGASTPSVHPLQPMPKRPSPPIHSQPARNQDWNERALSEWGQPQPRISGVVETPEEVHDVLAQNIQAGRRVLLFTTPNTENVSLPVSLAFARSLSNDGHRIVVLDLSPPDPELRTTRPGIRSLLTGRTRFTDVIVTDEQTGVHMICADKSSERVQFASSDKLSLILDALSQTYDGVFLAAPPVWHGNEARDVAVTADLSLLIAIDQTSRDQALESRERLINSGVDALLSYIPEDLAGGEQSKAA